MALKSKKPALAVPQTYSAADELLFRYGSLERQVEYHAVMFAAMVARTKTELEAVLEPIRAEQKTIAAQLQAYADAHREELTDKGKVKSHDMPSGKIGWRNSPPSVELKKGHKVDDVIEALKELRLVRFLRRTWALNKEAMLDDPDKASTVPGIRIKRDVESFYFEPTALPLSEGEP